MTKQTKAQLLEIIDGKNADIAALEKRLAECAEVNDRMSDEINRLSNLLREEKTVIEHLEAFCNAENESATHLLALAQLGRLGRNVSLTSKGTEG